MDDENEVIPALEEEENIDLDTELGDEEENQEEEVDWQARAIKAEEIAKNQRIRAEKAEKADKAPKAAKKPDTELSSTALYALIQANVPQEDVEVVTKYAKMENISVQEALKSNVVSTILADNAEKRRTAEVTTTGAARRSSGKVSSDTLLEKAKKGEMPESEEEMARLINARLGVK